MSYVDRFLIYAPLTDTLDVCGGDTVPSYVRVENRHFPPRTKGRFRVYVPEDQIGMMREKNTELMELVELIWQTHCGPPTAYGWVAVMEEADRLGIKLEYPK